MLYLPGQEGSESVAQRKAFQKPSDGKHCIKANVMPEKENYAH